MRKLYASTTFRFLSFALALMATSAATAQVEKPFLQRTSQYTPEKKIYNVKGDFAMIGNTSMTLQNYGDQRQNGNNVMEYVDIDPATLNGLGGIPTFNSSSATLTFSNENGAIPECSNIIFAGLYWTGRAANSSPSANQFSVTKDIVTGSTPFNNNFPNLGNGETVAGTAYGLSIWRVGSAGNYSPMYTFSGGGNGYQFRFNNSATNPVSVSINGGAQVNVPVTVTTSGFVKTATFNTPYTFTSGSVTITINKLIRDSRTDRTAVQVTAESKVDLNVSGSTTTTTSYTKNFDKRKIMLKGPGESGYTEFMASANDIYYPTTTNDFMYSGYVEVTDYVRNHGLGEYTAADIALVEGNGGGTGFYGGWGLIVVYENTRMKYRDITLFDGYAYVVGGTTASNELPISGFNTVQSGQVGLKIGVMAGEGDRDITGDYLQIKRQSDGIFQNLSHSANTENNFFNSSVTFPGARNPNLLNNTGLDLDVFQIPNPGNSVISNGQTATTFKYGSIQDTYIIFALAMAVDAYIPEIEGQLSAVSINGQPAGSEPYTVNPGDELEFKVEVRNRGTEPLDNANLIIPIPFNTDYVTGSGIQHIYYSPTPTPNNLTFDPTLGANGSLVWDIGHMPLPANPEVVLGDLIFKLTVTEDCNLLQSSCQTSVSVNGSVSATGTITGISASNLNLVLGYNPNGQCLGNAIPAPLLMTLDATDFINTNCQGVPEPVAFTFCTAQDSIPIIAVSGSFPSGSTFYSQYPVTADTVQYDINNPFPATAGTVTYYAVPPTQGQGCFFAFTITVGSVTTLPASAEDVTYCVGQTAQPLSATASNPSLTLFYFDSPDGIPQLSLIPSTATAGVFTYYAAEGSSADCYGEKIEITVTVLESITLTAPADVSIEGCGTDALSLPYSETQATISMADFVAAGGSVSNTAEGIPVFYSDVRSGNCPIVVTRTFSIEGSCGNPSAVQVLTIQDTTAPVLSALPDVTTFDGCTDEPQFATPTATDNCEDIANLTFTDATSTEGCITTITRTWTAADLCGNEATASQSIRFVDNAAPVFAALPTHSTINCDQTPEFAQAVASDTCSAEVTLTFIDSQNPGACPGSVIHSRTWTATDACGNSSTASQTITVQDIQAPEITSPAQNLTLECSTQDASVAIAEWLAANGNALATDSCSEITWSNDFASAPTSCNETVTVTFTATDGCGNSSTTQAQLLIQDSTGPVFTEVPASVSIECGQEPEFGNPVVTDACSAEVSLTFTDSESAGECAGSFVITRTWIATDACGNASEASQTITINDTTAPVISTPASGLEINCTTSGQLDQWLASNGGASATDACSSVTWTNDFSGSAPVCGAPVMVTFTATDACGNTATTSAQILLNDTEAPVAPQAPADTAVSCATLVPAPIELTAVDACSGEITVAPVDSIQPSDCAGTFTITRIWTFTDNCGNSSSVSQTITVNDTTPPTAPEAPEALTVSCPSDVPAPATLIAIDNCNNQEISATGFDVITAGSCPNSYTITRTWSFVDDCKNHTNISQIITVNDTTAPVFNVEIPADVTLECSEVPNAPVITATDNCGSEQITAILSETTTPGSCEGNFTLTRTWTATDACGNSTSATQTITVQDSQGPVVSNVPADVTLNCGDAIPSAQSLTAMDSCSGQTITSEAVEINTPGSCAGSFTLTRTWTFTDACGNTTTATQQIQVIDNTAPAFAMDLSGEITVNCGEVPAVPEITATDNCGTATVVFNESSVAGSCPEINTITRTWTASDECGNATSMELIIHVRDLVGPVLASDLETNISVNCGEVPEVPQLDFNDTCSSVNDPVFTETQTTPVGNAYVITRTWVATDSCGNESSFTQTINVTTNGNTVNASAYAACNIDTSLILDLTESLPAGTPAGGTFVDTDNSGAVQNNLFVPMDLATGVYLVDYVLSDDPCADTVRIAVTVDDDCEVQNECEPLVHNAFSPNGDGKNDIFVIQSFEDVNCIVDNQVEIYNRWGVLVFEMRNYNNTTRAFRGYSEGRATVKKSEELPAGTYFYVISYTKADGTSAKKDGYLYLSR